jgi:hypothetical protein
VRNRRREQIAFAGLLIAIVVAVTGTAFKTDPPAAATQVQR